MGKILIITIRGKGGGAEKIIENLVGSNLDKFIWINMEPFLHYRFLFRYIKFFWMIFNQIKKVDKIIIGTEGLLGLIVFPFRIFFWKKFILWNHCSFDDYKFFLNKKNRFFYRLSYIFYPKCISASPVFKKDCFLPNPYFFKKKISYKNNFLNSDSFLLLSVSSLARLKRVDRTIELLISLPFKYSLKIYGDGVERTNLQNIVVNAGVQERVSFLGFKDDPFEQNVSLARILIVNSETEALPTIIIEAIENNVPVIVREYNGAKYWKDFNMVTVKKQIEHDDVIERVNYFSRLGSDEYSKMFAQDISRLKKLHDYSAFAEFLYDI